MNAIDLNCDMGEEPEAIEDGTQEALMASLTSVNIACGGHAGDAQTMQSTIEQALRFGLAIGAHPGYPDRPNFGRVPLKLPYQAVKDFVFDQVNILAQIAARCGARITHVKPHGALYNQAARDEELAAAISRGVSRVSGNLILVGLAGSSMLEVFKGSGFVVAGEAFADRRYEPDGSLRSRKFPDALICDPAEAASQAVGIAKQGRVVTSDGSQIAVEAKTICIHGDTPGAPLIARAVARALQDAGISLRRLSRA